MPSANSSTPSSARSSSASSEPGASSSMRSIGICAEPTSARSSTCAPATPRRSASASCGSALAGSMPPPRMRSVIGSIAPHGISSDMPEDSPSILTSSATDSVGSPTGMSTPASPSMSTSPRVSSGAAELVPGDGQLAHDRVEHAAREHPVDLRQVAFGGRLRGLAAEQAFERLQHERQLDAHQHVPLDRSRPRLRPRSSRRAAAPWRRPTCAG